MVASVNVCKKGELISEPVECQVNDDLCKTADACKSAAAAEHCFRGSFVVAAKHTAKKIPAAGLVPL